MAKKVAKQTTSKKADDSKTFAFIAILLGIIGFVIALVTKRDDKYVMYYAKQSLVLMITGFAVMIVYWILTAIITVVTFGFGVIIMAPIGFLVWGGFLVLWVFGIIYSLSGEEKPIPIIGKYAEKINL